MPVKIGVLVNSCWNVYNFRQGLVKELINQGHEVTVFAPVDAYEGLITSWGLYVVDTPMKVTGTNPLQDIGYYRQLKGCLRKYAPNLLLSFTIKPNIYGSLVAHALKIPIICNVSGLGTAFLSTDIIRITALLLYRKAFRHSDYVFFQNKDDRKLFIDRVKINPSRSGLLPGSGINIHHYKGDIPKFEEPVVFLMISRLIREKGVLEFAEAAKKLSVMGVPAVFRLIGTYDQRHSRSYSEAEVSEWINSEWIDYQGPSDNILQEILAADVIVLPSYREGTPRTLLEGGSMSRPLITTDVPGCAEVVEDGVNGFLCKVKNSESLAGKMRLFMALTLPEKQNMAKASRFFIERKFDEQIVIDAYRRRIKHMIN